MATTRLQVVGHRGAAGLAPENTLAAFHQALALGVDAVECDVHLTRDGQLAVIHDAAVDRTTNGRGAIRDLDAETIGRLDAGGGEGVPFLPQVLAVVRGRAALAIELKASGTAGPAVAIVRAAGLLDAVVFISFDLGLLAEVRALESSASTGALFGEVPPDGIARAQALGCAWVQSDHRRADAGLVCAIHDAGLRALLWTPNETDELQRSLAMAPDAITTDRPDRLLYLLGRHPG